MEQKSIPYIDLSRIIITGGLNNDLHNHYLTTDILNNIKLISTQSSTEPYIYAHTHNKYIQSIKNIAHGSFGDIDLAVRRTGSKYKKKEYIYIKKPKTQGESLFREAYIQKLVHDTMQRYDIKATPNVYDIFSLRNESICFSMEKIQSSSTLHDIITSKKIQSNELDVFVLKILLSLCHILYILQKDIGFNHRDLKPDNIIIINHETQKRTINVEGTSLEITALFSPILIDFGFSCIGSPSGKVFVSSGNVYSPSDPCPKDGRDLYILLSFLLAYIEDDVSVELKTMIISWLDADGKGTIPRFIRKHKKSNSYIQWIYFIIGHPSIFSFACTPTKIINDIVSSPLYNRLI